MQCFYFKYARKVSLQVHVAPHGLVLQPALMLEVELLQVLQRNVLLFLSAPPVQSL